MNLDQILAGALAAAEAAAAELRAGMDNVRNVQEKSSHTDLVSATDLAAEAAARRMLAANFPDHDIVGEEEGAGSGRSADWSDLRSPWRWYVDPLDGTTNFVHGVPYYGVSLACLYEGELQVGVVLDPNQNETFHAVRGQGAFLNGRRLQVADDAGLRQALLSTGLSWDADTGQRVNLNRFNRLVRRTRNVRTLGSAALSLAYVAAGRLTGYWEITLKPWDTAAGVLLVTEAGGRVTHLDGRPFDPLYPDILASNGILHDDLLAELAAGAKE